MIPSLFLLFVAFGILIGSIVVGFGSIGLMLAGIAALALVTAYILLNRRSAS